MRILSTKQVRDLDAWTIEHEPIASIDLMERASQAFVDWFTLHVDVTRKVEVVCGTGNNGGDGLAIARLLHEWGFAVRVYIVMGGVGESPDFRINRSRLPEKVHQTELTPQHNEIEFSGDVLIDAVFGSGLSRAPEGLYAEVIERMNRVEAMRVAVDIPSGLMADTPSSGAIFRAHYTITFQLPKLAFMLPGSHAFTGEWILVDIGLDREFIRAARTDYFYTRLKNVKKILRGRSKFDHKGTYGHALLIAGSFGKMGAAVLASRAALRAGLGLLSVRVPQCGYTIIQTAVPEAMAYVDDDQKVFSAPPDLSTFTTLGIGPGLGQEIRTVKALGSTLEQFSKPVVLDADALNILGANRHLMSLIPAGSILTPHPKEFERLTGPWKNDFERLKLQRELSVSLKSVVVLKGAHSSICTPEGRFYFNSSGNPGMATGGTGDVLTGILTGLLAQNYSPSKAAIAGVYLHGLAGDIAAAELGMDSLTASDLIDNLPAAFQKVRK
jgi:NAD(P)H-hydrate epimerase